MNDLKVLLVDDDPLWLDIATLRFEEVGLKVVQANSSVDAQRAISETTFDLIVTDLDMPGESGWDLRRRIRHSEDSDKIPVVFLTSTNPEEDGLLIRPRISKLDDLTEVARRIRSIAALANEQARFGKDGTSRRERSSSLNLGIRNYVSLAIKRAIDLALVIFLLVAFLPIALIIVILIKLDDGGPIFFVQKRIGMDGDLINFRKFRTMRSGAHRELEGLSEMNHHGDSITFKMKSDPRITRVGKLLRRSSMDEMPQIWNVLLGEMTLVGPRPPIPDEVQRYGLEDWKRLHARPGMTGLWQVKGRGDIPFEQQLALDCRYIHERSTLGDLKILFLTIPAVLSGRGAY